MFLRESAEEASFRAEVRDFVQRELPIVIRDRVLTFQRVERDDYVCWQKILHVKGWGAPAWPREYGGTGWNATQRVIFEEECFAAGAPRQMPFGLSMCGPVLIAFGTEAQKAKFLPRIIAMDDWWCQGYSEPGAGSDLASLKTRAVRQGDKYVINGQKTWTSFAHWANWIFCLVRTDPEAKPQAGISFLLIDMKSPGVTVRPIRTLDQGADVNEVFLDNVEVPLENLVGEENKGWAIAKYLLGHERTNIAGIGMCKRLMRRVKEMAGTCTKRGRPLVEDPRFRARISQLDMQLICHEWSLLRIISLESGNKPIGPEASVLKIRGSEIQQDLTELLMDIAGPYAVPYVPEALELGSTVQTAGDPLLNPLAGQFLDMRKISIYGGANEIQKNIIAKAILDL
ncbi:acyl-CoA dehydrogenase family protein [Aromatoleum petrolei]|uniref:Pimeloyl-CoA dehydrogenase large subunit n=1 Tax=Aromatoleum petrolei TaxID=76116 RepID=A0ABX1MPJ9_9RHOO|nr:acyl-CoA dehydrogenase family protein [Aromatoleum petrolei]NMF88573.1 pimeloyl-CoA dehydrogenase large subunit [Aromatoleum petrolei]QTQ34719.1 Putative acyl-CoA dehydrogenase/oxidase [Aromatoleum petrolei]